MSVQFNDHHLLDSSFCGHVTARDKRMRSRTIVDIEGRLHTELERYEHTHLKNSAL